jgi:hypothetical protein
MVVLLWDHRSSGRAGVCRPVPMLPLRRQTPRRIRAPTASIGALRIGGAAVDAAIGAT